MTYLIAGVVLFVGLHLLPGVLGQRDRLTDLLGAVRYRLVFSLLAVSGLILMIVGFSQAEIKPVFTPPVWGKYVAYGSVALAFVLFAMAGMKTNIRRLTPDPMFWGIVLWAGGHLFANGNLADVVLFGAFVFFGSTGLISSLKRSSREKNIRLPLKKDIMGIIAGLVAYAVFAKWLHPLLIGVPVT